ncbi:MAG: aminotransferase class I/II-fold pyridoxal phosphate-dependent enzyme, partial [Spirochaetota bacterium]
MLEFVSRKGSRCLKYDELEERFGSADLLPLWVADMDCRAPQVVEEALAQQLKHGVYGYYSQEMAEDSKNAVCHWLSGHHGVGGLEAQDCFIFSGVLQSLAVCIEVFCPKDRGVILNAPAYNCFYSTIAASGRAVLENKLRADGAIDHALLERQIRSSAVKPSVFLLCNPHNPSGHVWDKQEIFELIRICKKYDLYLISDEVHFDLVYPGRKHESILNPEFSSLYDKIIMLSAPNKTFNLPGLRTSYLISRNPELRKPLEEFALRFALEEISITGHLALQSCYTRPEAGLWLEELLKYLKKNRDFLAAYLDAEFPELIHRKPESTYLYWINCQNFRGGDPEELRKFFIHAGLALGWGDLYHGNGCVRINFACADSL